MTKFNEKKFTVPVGGSEEYREGHKSTFGEEKRSSPACGHFICAKKSDSCLFEPKPTEPVRAVIPQLGSCVGGCGRQAEAHSLFCAACDCV